MGNRVSTSTVSVVLLVLKREDETNHLESDLLPSSRLDPIFLLPVRVNASLMLLACYSSLKTNPTILRCGSGLHQLENVAVDPTRSVHIKLPLLNKTEVFRRGPTPNWILFFKKDMALDGRVLGEMGSFMTNQTRRSLNLHVHCRK